MASHSCRFVQAQGPRSIKTRRPTLAIWLGSVEDIGIRRLCSISVFGNGKTSCRKKLACAPGTVPCPVTFGPVENRLGASGLQIWSIAAMNRFVHSAFCNGALPSLRDQLAATLIDTLRMLLQDSSLDRLQVRPVSVPNDAWCHHCLVPTLPSAAGKPNGNTAANLQFSPVRHSHGRWMV